MNFFTVIFENIVPLRMKNILGSRFKMLLLDLKAQIVDTMKSENNGYNGRAASNKGYILPVLSRYDLK